MAIFRWSRNQPPTTSAEPVSLEGWKPPTLQRPPRDLGLLLRARIVTGSFSQRWFGWVFFSFGMVFVWLFLPRADFASLYRYHGQLDQAQAVVTASAQTSMSEGGGENSDGTPIHEHQFEFTAPGGKAVRGVSYETGMERHAGDRVTVEFPASNPQAARIVGARTKPFPPFAGCFVLIFPGIGLAFMAAGMRGGARKCGLLRHGEVAGAVATFQEATSTSIDEKPVMRMHHRFTARDGNEYDAVALDHRPQRYDDGQVKLVFYDANDPTRNTLLLDMNGPVEIDEQGCVRDGAPVRTFLWLLVPMTSVVGNVAAAVFVLR